MSISSTTRGTTKAIVNHRKDTTQYSSVFGILIGIQFEVPLILFMVFEVRLVLYDNCMSIWRIIKFSFLSFV